MADTGHTKNQENMIHFQKIELVEMGPEITEMMELANKDIKTTIITTFRYLKQT